MKFTTHIVNRYSLLGLASVVLAVAVNALFFLWQEYITLRHSLGSYLGGVILTVLGILAIAHGGALKTTSIVRAFRSIRLPYGRIGKIATAAKGDFITTLSHEIRTPTNGTIAKADKGDSFAHQNPAKILVVEDQPLNQKIACMLLQHLGYTKIEIANNGQEAVDMCASSPYDIIFMDLHMPVLGGIDATRAIRANFNLKKQPRIIAMTGHALVGVKEECREIGMNAFLTKPVSLDDFRRVIPPAISSGAAKIVLTL